MRTLSCALTVVVLVFSARRLEAQGSTAQECCLTLLFPYGARAVSLGQALTARTSIDGVFFNPASLANLGRDEFMVHGADTFEGQSFAFTLAINKGVAGTFALTPVVIDLGQIEETDENGTPVGETPAGELHLHGTYATTLTRGLRGGITITLYYRSVVESATTLLLNTGIQYRVPRVRGLELGASLMQAGLALQVRNAEQKDPTPTRIRFGAAYELGHVLMRDSAVSFWLSGDMVARPRSFASGTATDSIRGRASGWAPTFNVGVELGFNETLGTAATNSTEAKTKQVTIFLRGGYAMSGDGLAAGGGGIGVGIRYEPITIAVGKSFATTPLQEAGGPFQVSIGVTF